VATGADQNVVLCVPPSVRGLAPQLSVEALPGPSCDAVDANVITVDNFTLASDPSCGPSP
jgi:hypothetical protein